MLPIAFLALLIVQINFGILPIAQKITLASLSPLALFAVRSLGAACLFSLSYAIIRPKPVTVGAFSQTPAKTYLFLSLLGISLNQFLLILALTQTTAIATVIVVPSITLFTYAFAILLKKEHFAWDKAIILTLGGTGVLLMFSEGILHMWQHLDASVLIGNVLCLFSAAVYGLYLVLSRDYIGRQPALEFTAKMFSWALVWLALLLLMAASWHLLSKQDLSWQGLFLRSAPLHEQSWHYSLNDPKLLLTLAFIVIGPTVTNYFLNLWALRFLPASTVSGFISLQTLIGSTLSHLILGEEIKPHYVISAFCIICSIVLLSIQSWRQQTRTVPTLTPASTGKV